MKNITNFVALSAALVIFLGIALIVSLPTTYVPPNEQEKSFAGYLYETDHGDVGWPPAYPMGVQLCGSNLISVSNETRRQIHLMIRNDSSRQLLLSNDGLYFEGRGAIEETSAASDHWIHDVFDVGRELRLTSIDRVNPTLTPPCEAIGAERLDLTHTLRDCLPKLRLQLGRLELSRPSLSDSGEIIRIAEPLIFEQQLARHDASDPDCVVW